MKFLVLILITILIKNLINASNIDYSKCLNTRTYCQSIPENCMQDNSECHTLLIASPDVGAGVQFELFGKVDKSRHWFAMGLSKDRQMGNDSVTEIYVNDGKPQMRQSWDDGKHNTISERVEGITQIGDVVNSNGILSAKWIRNAVTEDHSNRFDIMNTNYNILLATGPIDANNAKRIYSGKSASKTEVDLQFSNEQELKDAYKTCNNSKTTICLGLPDDCIVSQKCNLVLVVTKGQTGSGGGTVVFQLIGKPDDKNSGWMAAALSDDNQMGSDSVVECLLLSNSTTVLRSSWNEGEDNQVIGNVKGITQLGNIVFDKGLLNCKWSRAATTKVKDTSFDLSKKNYYILVAKGLIDDQKTATKSQHSDRTPSKTAFDLESKAISTTTHTISPTPIPSQMSDAYKRCHNNERLCFGIKKGYPKCMDSNDCTVLFSSVWNKSAENAQIELFYAHDSSSNNKWAAVGLSDDNTMGEDIVTECILMSDGNVVLRGGWNPGGKQPTVNIKDNSTISLVTSFLNGVVYCKWNRNAFSSVEGKVFDIKNNTYYLLLAHGSSLSSDQTNLRKHIHAQSSSEKVNLQSVGLIEAASLLSIQFHATLMIIGWLGCVGTAILLARHYKNSWPDSTLCGVKIWFAFHRSLMICGVVLVLASTILIFVSKKGWVGASAHPIVGLTSIILCFLQPIGALFRPNADSPKRWIFNWMHWSGGYIGYLLSFVAICLSTNFSILLPKKTETLWVLIAYIILYILSHALHHLKTILRERQKQKQKQKDIQTDNETNNNVGDDGTLVDLILALLNVVVIFAFVLALVILLFI